MKPLDAARRVLAVMDDLSVICEPGYKPTTGTEVLFLLERRKSEIAALAPQVAAALVEAARIIQDIADEPTASSGVKLLAVNWLERMK